MSGSALRTAIHARITPDADSGYVATCRQDTRGDAGRTLDEVTANLREAVALHLDDEDLAALGSPPSPHHRDPGAGPDACLAGY